MVFLVIFLQYPWAAYDIFRGGGDKLIIAHEACRNFVSPPLEFLLHVIFQTINRPGGGKCEMCWQDLYINKKKTLF